MTEWEGEGRLPDMLQTSPNRPSLITLLLLLAGLLLLTPGCAPHRRGQLPPLSDQPVARPESDRPDRSRPGRERAQGGTRRPPVGMPQGTPADTLAGEAAAPEVGAVTADGLEVCRLAMEHLGTPYRYGGSTVKGFDCSGFARFIYKKVGVELPRSSVEQARYAHHVPKDELRVGDLLCFNNGRGRISHVGIYIGHGDFIHSTSTGGRVQIDSLDEPWWTKSLETIRRVLPD